MENPSTLLVVKNLSISRDFYVKVLGLDLIEEHNDRIKLRMGHHQVFMFQGTMDSVEYKHGFNANSTLVFTVRNLEQKIQELKLKDVIFVHSSPNQNMWGRYAAFIDPSGIVHELMELCT